MNSWVNTLATLVGGSVAWEGIKFFYPSFTREIKAYREAHKNLYESIDPILKAADELYGKMISIALEYIRMKSQYSSISKIKKGRELLKFIETYESRTFRLVDRSIQRMIGESLIINSTGSYRVMSLSHFI